MKYYHSLFKQLHFDYGRMLWSVNHVPFFGALMSVCDHRNIGALHSISFYALLRVLTNGKIKKKQADAIFALIDLSANGEISFSEIAFWIGVVVAQKDHLEREFLYMHAWKIWVTFNETGAERMATKEFRKAGLFFDFDYPTIYHMYKDYNWDDEIPLEFERFRFFLVSCIHFRSLRRATAKYLRYKKFKHELLHVLHPPLARVQKYNIYPPPTAILRAIKTIKIPPIEGQEKVYHWSDVFTLHWIRKFVSLQWKILKLRLMKLRETSNTCRWILNVCCCGLICIGTDDEGEAFDDLDKYCTKCCTSTWNAWCLCCCCCGCCGYCLLKNKLGEAEATPLKPVVIRRDVDIEVIAEMEKNRHLFRPKQVEFGSPKDDWKNIQLERTGCAVQ